MLTESALSIYTYLSIILKYQRLLYPLTGSKNIPLSIDMVSLDIANCILYATKMVSFTTLEFSSQVLISWHMTCNLRSHHTWPLSWHLTWHLTWLITCHLKWHLTWNLRSHLTWHLTWDMKMTYDLTSDITSDMTLYVTCHLSMYLLEFPMWCSVSCFLFGQSLNTYLREHFSVPSCLNICLSSI